MLDIITKYDPVELIQSTKFCSNIYEEVLWPFLLLKYLKMTRNGHKTAYDSYPTNNETANDTYPIKNETANDSYPTNNETA